MSEDAEVIHIGEGLDLFWSNLVATSDGVNCPKGALND